MATRNIDTSSAQYQNALSNLVQIVNYYKPIVKEYFEISDPIIQQDWRDRDQILDIFLTIAEKVNERNREW